MTQIPTRAVDRYPPLPRGLGVLLRERGPVRLWHGQRALTLFFTSPAFAIPRPSANSWLIVATSPGDALSVVNRVLCAQLQIPLRQRFRYMQDVRCHRLPIDYKFYLQSPEQIWHYDTPCQVLRIFSAGRGDLQDHPRFHGWRYALVPPNGPRTWRTPLAAGHASQTYVERWVGPNDDLLKGGYDY